MKPDISAPSNSLVAVAGTGNQYQSYECTSFVSPLVTGAVAKLLENATGRVHPLQSKRY
jgi:ribosomal protein S3AE